ncbi:MAG: TIGR02391 family protein [Microthrixaceae bacterium]
MGKHIPEFDSAVIDGVSKAIGEAFSGTELTPLMRTAGLIDPGEGTKWKRIRSGLEQTQVGRRSGQGLVNLVSVSCKPARWVGKPSEFADLRRTVNQPLAFAGIRVDETGQIRSQSAATSLDDIAHLTQHMRDELRRRGGHDEVFRYCTPEPIAEDCFGAVFESVKGLSDRIRSMTGDGDDGARLVQNVFEGDNPVLVFNPWETGSQKDEQRGLANIMKGIFGAFRNPLAHEPRIHWAIDQADALDLLTTLSLLHRRLDGAVRRPR